MYPVFESLPTRQVCQCSTATPAPLVDRPIGNAFRSLDICRVFMILISTHDVCLGSEAPTAAFPASPSFVAPVASPKLMPAVMAIPLIAFTFLPLLALTLSLPLSSLPL